MRASVVLEKSEATMRDARDVIPRLFVAYVGILTSLVLAQGARAQPAEGTTPRALVPAASAPVLEKFIPEGSLYAVRIEQSALERSSFAQQLQFKSALLELLLAETNVKEVWSQLDRLIVIASPESLASETTSSPPALILRFSEPPAASWMPRPEKGASTHAAWNGRDYYRPAGDSAICTCVIDRVTTLMARETELRAMIDAEATVGKIEKALVSLGSGDEVNGVFDVESVPRSFLGDTKPGTSDGTFETEYGLTTFAVIKYADLIYLSLRFEGEPQVSLRFACASKVDAGSLTAQLANMVTVMRITTVEHLEQILNAPNAKLSPEQSRRVQESIKAIGIIFDLLAPAHVENGAVIRVSGRAELAGALALNLPAIAGMQKAARDARARNAERAKKAGSSQGAP